MRKLLSFQHKKTKFNLLTNKLIQKKLPDVTLPEHSLAHAYANFVADDEDAKEKRFDFSKPVLKAIKTELENPLGFTLSPSLHWLY